MTMCASASKAVIYHNIRLQMLVRKGSFPEKISSEQIFTRYSVWLLIGCTWIIN